MSEYWYCNNCKEELCSERVTYQEKCDTCGHEAEWVESETLQSENERLTDILEDRATKSDDPILASDSYYEVASILEVKPNGSVIDTARKLMKKLKTVEAENEWLQSDLRTRKHMFKNTEDKLNDKFDDLKEAREASRLVHILAEKLKAENERIKKMVWDMIDDFAYPDSADDTRQWNSHFRAYHRGMVLGDFSCEPEEMKEIESWNPDIEGNS